MSDPLPASDLRPELLDDFYAECDEHLTVLREQLATLESALSRGETNAAAIESLYRSIHSFKGNAAIVGLAPAEQLAHAAEGLLRSFSRRELAPSAPLLDLLGRAGQLLQELVADFRLKKPLPAIGRLLEEFKPFAAARPPGPAPAAPPVSPAPPSTHEGLVWHAAFSPSPGLDARGVNVGRVRERLSSLGRIVKAAPSIQAGGKMTFEFTVELREVPGNLEEWEADGVVLSPAEAKEEAAASEPAPSASGLFIAPSHIVRVDLGRLDELMRIAGEMVIHRSRLEDRLNELTGDRAGLQEVNLAFGRSLRELRAAITRVRLVSVAEIFGRLPFAVRDLSRNSRKRVRLQLEGQSTEIDKFVVERLKEPLLHLVRNALSHGVESPEERRAAGKSEEATLLLRASAAGDSVVIEVKDDGRGINAERVAERARSQGLAVPEPLDAVALLNLICTPGFSTREEADLAAGRGVGMGVVAQTVRDLGGSLTLETTPGQGTQFTLRLPLTLSIADTVIVSAAGQLCAVPQAAIEEVIQVAASDSRQINHVEVTPYRAGVLPLLRLRAWYGAEPSDRPESPVVVLTSDRGRAGLVVDRVVSRREIVVRPMTDPLVKVQGVAGATELGDGRAVLILDPAALTAAALRPRELLSA